jgi:hypothetical protein
MQQPPATPEVRTNRLVIVDDAGRPRISLCATDDGAVLSMLDTRGSARLRMSLIEDDCLGGRTTISMIDQAGQMRWALTLADNEEPKIAVLDEHGNFCPPPWLNPPLDTEE